MDNTYESKFRPQYSYAELETAYKGGLENAAHDTMSKMFVVGAAADVLKILIKALAVVTVVGKSFRFLLKMFNK